MKPYSARRRVTGAEIGQTGSFSSQLSYAISSDIGISDAPCLSSAFPLAVICSLTDCRAASRAAAHLRTTGPIVAANT